MHSSTRTSGFSAAVVFVALLACKNEDAPAPATSAAPAASPAAPATPEPAPEPAASEAERPVAPNDDPIPDIPEGRSKPPTVAEWSAASEVNTQEKNSQPDKCFMKIVREWLKVNCSGQIVSVNDPEGFGTEGADYFSSIRPGKSADFVVRLREGKTMKTKIIRYDDSASLFVNWPAGAPKPTIVALGKGPRGF